MAGGSAGRRTRAGSGEGKKPSDPGSQARDVCIRLLAVRPRTRSELDAALRNRGFDDDVIAEVLDRYSDVGIIDDDAFARAWVSSRHHGKGLARRALAGELRRKGVADESVGAALDDIDTDTEEATARALVERRLRIERSAPRRVRPPAAGSGRLDSAEPSDDPEAFDDGPDERAVRAAERQAQAALVRKLVSMLARKGYPSGLAFRVVREALADESDAGDMAELVASEEDIDDRRDFDQLRS